MFPDDDWILVESYNIKMFIFEVTVVLYFIKILSGSCNFYRLRIPVTISCLPIQTPPPLPGKFSSTALLQSLAKSLLHYSYYSSPIRELFVLFVDYSRTIRTIRRLFAGYSYYSSTIRLFARFTIPVLSIAGKFPVLKLSYINTALSQ
jgi:hypothetical protein